MMTELVTLLTLTVYDPALPGERTLYFGTHHFVTTPLESPANTVFVQRLKQPCAVKRDAFDSGTISGRSRAGYGSLRIANGDGAYDWLLDCAVDGRAIEQRSGDVTHVGAYPTVYPVTFLGTGLQIVGGRGDIEITLRDLQGELDTPIQVTKYLGDNVLPDGLEGGVADLKGKPKPIALGRPFNVPCTLVNSAKLIYQVHDGAGWGPLSAIENACVRGIVLGAGRSFATQTSPFTASSSAITCSAYGASIYVMAGANGKLASSPNTVTWTLRTSTFGAARIWGMCFGNSLFVIVGDAGALATSLNGTSWTSRTSGTANTLLGVAWCPTLALFVACGASGTIITSPDGINWTTQTSGWGLLHCYAVIEEFGVAIVVGSYGQVVTSLDGIVWTMRTTDFSPASGLFAIASDGTRLVAAGSSIAVSDDGLAWTRYESPTLAASVAYGNGWTIGGNSGFFYTTPDPTDVTSWEYRGLPSIGTIYTIAFLNGEYLIGTGSFEIITSTVDSYASEADLLDDDLAPLAGEYKPYPAGGYIRLGNTPDGLVTCSPTQGATAADRTAAQLYDLVLTGAGYAVDAGDLTALDADNSSELGLYIGEEASIGAVVDQIAGSVGAFWGPDIPGVFRIKRFEAPAGLPVLSFTENDFFLDDPLTPLAPNDALKGLPHVRTIKRWGRNYTVQTTDVAAGVEPSRRAEIAKEWREAVSEDPSVLTVHLLAGQASSDTLFIAESDAQDEADREQTLLGVKRRRFRGAVPLTPEVDALEMLDVVEVIHSRYGLSAGALYVVIGVDPVRTTRKRCGLMLWGS